MCSDASSLLVELGLQSTSPDAGEEKGVAGVKFRGKCDERNVMCLGMLTHAFADSPPPHQDRPEWSKGVGVEFEIILVYRVESLS